MKERVEIGVIGGSGFCTFPELEVKESVNIETKYGKPSAEISVGEYGGQIIAFLPRHGYKHELAPHLIPYRANTAALREMGIGFMIAFCATGSLNKEIKPGDFVIPDQFVNFTWGRDTVQDPEEKFVHLPMAEPYSEKLRKVIYEEGKNVNLKMHQAGTVVVIQGPRFNTRAESVWFSKMGWSIVNMTQYPECYFAKEAGIHYATIAGVTDYDVCLQNLGLNMDKDKLKESSEIFKENVKNCKILIEKVLQNWEEHKKNIYHPHEKQSAYYQDGLEK